MEPSEANTYTGTTTVNAGTLILSRFTGTTVISNESLSITGNLVIGDGSGTDTVKLGTVEGGAVSNGILINQIADTSAVTINTGGVLNLNRFSEQIGSLTMTGGQVSIVGRNSGSGPLFTIDGALNMSGGAKIAATNGENTQIQFGGNISTSGDTTINIGGSTASGGSSNGFTFDFGGAARTFTVADGAATIDLAIGSGVNTGVDNYKNGSGVKEGAGLMEIRSRNDPNDTFTGWTVNAGTLRMASVDVLGRNGSNATQTTTVNGGTLDLVTFSQHSRAGVVLAGGAINSTTGTLTVDSGKTFDVRSGSASAILAGTGALLTKTTDDTVTLSGANTYTGATSVSGGTLVIGDGTNGSIANGTVSVSAGTLTGDRASGNNIGTGLVTIGDGAGGTDSVITAGTATNAIGLLAMGGALTLNSDANFRFDLNSTLAVGDRVNVAGTTTINALSVFSFNAFGDNSGFFGGQTFTAIGGAGSITGQFFNLAEGAFISSNGVTLQANNYTTAGDLIMTVTAVPEPSTFAMILGGAGMLTLLRRRGGSARRA